MSRMVTVDDGVDLYVEDEGSGEPVVFVPGWTCTSRFFKKQKDHVAASRRFIAYDPRAHGRSSKPADGHTFTRRGADLARLLELLELSGATLVGWSFGAYDVLACLRDHGFARTARLIILDMPPKCPVEEPGQWGEFPLDANARTGLVRPLIDSRRAFWTGYAQYMIGVDEDQTPEVNEDVREIVEEGLLCPDTAAFANFLDGAFSDFTETAIRASKTVPTTVMAREDWADAAEAWTRRTMPRAHFVRIPTHMAFWSHPADFNAKLDAILGA
jgi:pimeloyl-ACP methyl ester carboxylesterase